MTDDARSSTGGAGLRGHRASARSAGSVEIFVVERAPTIAGRDGASRCADRGSRLAREYVEDVAAVDREVTGSTVSPCRDLDDVHERVLSGQTGVVDVRVVRVASPLEVVAVEDCEGSGSAV